MTTATALAMDNTRLDGAFECLRYSALGVSPQECFELAYDRVLSPGRFLKVHYASHYMEAAS